MIAWAQRAVSLHGCTCAEQRTSAGGNQSKSFAMQGGLSEDEVDDDDDDDDDEDDDDDDDDDDERGKIDGQVFRPPRTVV